MWNNLLLRSWLHRHANEDCAMGDLCWCINTDELLLSVKFYPSPMTICGSANERTCFDVHVPVVPSSSCGLYDLKGSVCLTVPFWLIIHWSAEALGSALLSTIYSNQEILNLRTAWQYSQMGYRILHYIDFVNAFTYSPTVLSMTLNCILTECCPGHDVKLHPHFHCHW